MKIVNLTAHPVRVINEDNKIIATFPPSGKVARALTEFEPGWTIEIEDTFIPTSRPKLKGIADLPPPKDGVLYIVSIVLFNKIKGRRDVIAPDTGLDCIKDGNGNVFAVRRFLVK
ncbi:MAG TPA: hypothetical protein ENL09_05035 [Bacteroidetes bacterium]|nr:hypothetical protein [Bacteroidota bacterium]